MTDIGEIVKRQLRGAQVVRQIVASAGWVYVMTNPSIPGMVKIGMTRGDIYDRARALSNTNVPTPFDVYYAKRCACALDVEQHAFQLLAKHRVNPAREFFACDPVDARDTVREAAESIESMIDMDAMDEARETADPDHFDSSVGPGSVIVVCAAFAKILGETEMKI